MPSGGPGCAGRRFRGQGLWTCHRSPPKMQGKRSAVTGRKLLRAGGREPRHGVDLLAHPRGEPVYGFTTLAFLGPANVADHAGACSPHSRRCLPVPCRTPRALGDGLQHALRFCSSMRVRFTMSSGGTPRAAFSRRVYESSSASMRFARSIVESRRTRLSLFRDLSE